MSAAAAESLHENAVPALAASLEAMPLEREAAMKLLRRLVPVAGWESPSETALPEARQQVEAAMHLLKFLLQSEPIMPYKAFLETVYSLQAACLRAWYMKSPN